MKGHISQRIFAYPKSNLQDQVAGVGKHFAQDDEKSLPVTPDY